MKKLWKQFNDWLDKKYPEPVIVKVYYDLDTEMWHATVAADGIEVVAEYVLEDVLARAFEYGATEIHFIK